MKRLILAAAGALLIGTSAFAQEKKQRHDPSERIEMKVNRMGEKLNLTEDQKSELKTVYIKFHEEAKAQREAEKKKMKSLADAREKKVQQIMGEEKYKEYEALKAEERAKMQERRKEHHRHPAAPQDAPEKKS